MGEYLGQIKPLYGTPINPTHWASQGLVGQWLFNEGTGLIAHDSSGNNNHGSLVNMSNTPTSGWVPGDGGGALAFDGVNDYVNLYNKFGHIYNNFTVLITAKQLFTSGGQQLIGKGQASSLLNTFNLYWWGSSSLYFIWSNGTNYDSIAWPSLSPLDNIYMVAASFSYGKAKCYKNGYLVRSKDSFVTYTKATTDNVLVGVYPSFGLFSGDIYSIRIYNRALSADEIQYLYQNPYCMYEQPRELISWKQDTAASRYYYQHLLAGGN